ncbi:MAG: DUF4349 domain-containing protein [Fimbriimonadales bacterium]
MSTQGIREDLKAYLDGELPEERAAEVRHAIEFDPSLREETESFGRIGDSLRNMTIGPEPRGAEAARAASVTQKKWWLTASAGIAAAAACLLIAMVVVRGVDRGMSETAAPDLASEVDLKEQQGKAPAGTLLSEDIVGRPLKTLGGAAPEATVESPRAEADRAVVRTGNLSLRVANLKQSETKATSLVKSWGGYVEDSESSDLESEHPSMLLTLRVPEAHFETALTKFEELGVRTAKSVTGKDVTAQLVDMDARLKNLRAQEETYRQILGHSNKVGEVLSVQQHLSEIRGEIEAMAASRQSMAKLAALSTISLTLQQRPAAKELQGDAGWASDAWASATQTLGDAFKALSVAVIWAFVYAPLWLPIAFFGRVLARRVARR